MSMSLAAEASPSSYSTTNPMTGDDRTLDGGLTMGIPLVGTTETVTPPFSRRLTRCPKPAARAVLCLARHGYSRPLSKQATNQPLLIVVGLTPVCWRKTRLKCPAFVKPHLDAISPICRSLFSSKDLE